MAVLLLHGQALGALFLPALGSQAITFLTVALIVEITVVGLTAGLILPGLIFPGLALASLTLAGKGAIGLQAIVEVGRRSIGARIGTVRKGTAVIVVVVGHEAPQNREDRTTVREAKGFVKPGKGERTAPKERLPLGKVTVER